MVEGNPWEALEPWVEGGGVNQVEHHLWEHVLEEDSMGPRCHPGIDCDIAFFGRELLQEELCLIQEELALTPMEGGP